MKFLGRLLLWQKLTLLIAALLVLELALSTVAICEKARGRNPQAEKWGKRKLATEGVVAVTLVVGLWLVAAGFKPMGQSIVTIALAAVLVAMYLGAMSIRGHWNNLRSAA